MSDQFTFISKAGVEALDTAAKAEAVATAAADATSKANTAQSNAIAAASADATAKANAAKLAAIKRANPRPALPQVMGRVREMGAGTGLETLHLHFTGDSLASKLPAQMLPLIESKCGLAGVGGILCIAVATAGAPALPSSDGETDPERTKFAEDGYVVLLADGDAVKIGRRVTGPVPFAGDSFSLALGQQSGNGSARISVSYNDGVTWETAIETVDTAAASLGLLVRAHTVLANREIVIRVEAVGGPVQVVQTRIWNSLRSGVVLSYSGRSGATLGQYVAASSPAFRATLMGMYAPHLVFGMFSESLEEIVDLDAWLQLVLDSAPAADVLMANLPYMGNRDPEAYTDVINTYYDAAATEFPRVFIYDINAHFRSIGYLTESGIGDPPDVHMTVRASLGWKSVAVDLAARLGLGVSTALPVEVVGKISTSGSVPNLIVRQMQKFANFWTMVQGSQLQTWLIGWFNSAGVLNSFRMRRRSDADAMAPSGLDFRSDIDGANTTFALMDSGGTLKLGPISISLTTTAGADGFRFVSIAGNSIQGAARFLNFSTGSVNVVVFGRSSGDFAAVDRRGQFVSDTGFGHGFTGAGPKWLSGAVTPDATATITITSPGVITVTGHGFPNGMLVKFASDGALPSGITAGTSYFTKNVTANTFEIATTPTSTSITTTGTQSGTHTCSAVGPNGSLYSRSGGGGELYVQQSGAWVLK
jgi:hypothetical protein